MVDLQTNYLSPKLEARKRPTKGDHGVYARENVKEGELLLVWGGKVVTEKQLGELALEAQQHSVQIEEGLYLASSEQLEPADMVNHSCDPNAWIRGQIVLVARRDIKAGEEVCFDYATTDGSPYDEFDCTCGATGCRGRVTGNDWQLPELQERYRGYFSFYLEQRIERLKKTK
ncbi:MAG: SET domain-containing protein [Candidatus Odinarchaeota archaeon]